MLEHEKKINVNFAEGETVKELIIREGTAESPLNNHPKQVIISGDINSITNYMIHRENLLKKETTVIVFNEVDGCIQLNADPSNNLALIIKARLETYPDLDNFGINKGKFFTQTELEQQVKMHRIWFANKDEYDKILAELARFRAKVQSEMEAAKDKRGNQTSNFSKQVTSDLSADFKLYMPLFKGMESRIFRVEICYDVTDSSVRFWLESVELFELQKGAIALTFKPQWKLFQEKQFTCINI